MPRRDRALTGLAFAAFAVGLLADLANLLNYNNYPLFSLEVGVVALTLLMIAGTMAGLHHVAQPRLGFIFTGLFLTILIDLGAEIGMSTLYVVGGLITLVAWFRQRNVLTLGLAAFGAVLLMQSLQLATGVGKPAASPLATYPNEAKRLQASDTRNEKLPPIIHLMLDSYIGLEGMSSADGNFGNLRREQERFYFKQGFQIYPQAYSRHGKTVNSLPEFLSYGRAQRATKPRNVQFTVAPPLDYFVDLDRRGYRTSVRTPSFVDLCVNQPLSSCHNYNRSDLRSMASSGLSAIDRARMIGLTLLELSKFTAIAGATIDDRASDLAGGDRRILFNRTKLYSLTGFAQLDAFTQELSNLKRGEAHFVHLLLPHDPYIMDENCKLLPEPQWLDEHGPGSFERRDAAYANQTRCMTNGGLSRLLAALDKTEAGRAAIVIIQGDHGSRTVDHVPWSDEPQPSLRAMMVTYSAFFAVRVPGESAAAIQGRYALDELIGGFAKTGFASAPRPSATPAEVYLMDRKWIPEKRVALPEVRGTFTEN